MMQPQNLPAQTALDFGIPKNVPTFHNTIDAKGEDLENRQDKAKGQQDVILEFFKHNRDKDFTAWEIWKLVLPDEPLLGNIRRSITNLKKADLLIKTGNMTSEIGRVGYGTPNHTYKLA